MILTCIVQVTFSAPAKVKAMRTSFDKQRLRLVIDITDKVKYQVKVDQDQLTIVLLQAQLSKEFKSPVLLKNYFSSLTVKKVGKNIRVVLLANKKESQFKVNHFLLNKPQRLVLDITDEAKSENVALASPSLHEEQSTVELDPDVSEDIDKIEQKLLDKIYPYQQRDIDRDKNSKLREIVIVIDPGHGGHDPGAIGLCGTKEKIITLAIAKKLQEIINNHQGFHAILTRDGDYFIPLRRRLNIAHKHHADMFVSVHADAYRRREAHGASVFALSQRGATSEAARWLAEKENESELGQAILDKSAVLRSVLLDLAQTATISASLDIGGKVLQSLSKVADLHSRQVEQAAFVVLKSPDIPSLLIEVGFISYRAEEKQLIESSYQHQVATKIADGIKNYFLAHPPEGSQLEKFRSNYISA